MSAAKTVQFNGYALRPKTETRCPLCAAQFAPEVGVIILKPKRTNTYLCIDCYKHWNSKVTGEIGQVLAKYNDLLTEKLVQASIK